MLEKQLYGSYDSWDGFESRDSKSSRLTPTDSTGPTPLDSLGATPFGSKRPTPKNSNLPFAQRWTSETDYNDLKSRNRVASPVIFEERHSYDSDVISTDRTDRSWDRIHSRYGRLPAIPYEVDEDQI